MGPASCPDVPVPVPQVLPVCCHVLHPALLKDGTAGQVQDGQMALPKDGTAGLVQVGLMALQKDGTAGLVQDGQKALPKDGMAGLVQDVPEIYL